MGVPRKVVDARRPRAPAASASESATHGQQQQAQWKGKKRDEGSGGKDGIVLSLNLVGDGTYTAVYTVNVAVGNDSQTFPLQVDTGSSDLWVASTTCSTAPCTNNKPKLYNPGTSSTPTNQNFEIDYLSGQVTGPVVWDKIVLGGYEIDNQALAAASTVVNETLSPQFSGILGLALPLDSVISNLLPPVTSNTPDGATLISNLFGITPTSQAPDQLFYSLLLERPGSGRVPSVLGIGRHPSDDILKEGLTIDPADVMYGSVIPEASGAHFWKVELRAISVYVNGTRKDVNLGRSVTGSVFPEAILDSGVPFIIGTPAIANGVWGALGIGPAGDGNYYVDCATPLNMTVTLDDRREIPIHPLDLSAPSQDDPSSSTCVGIVQQYAPLASPTFGLGDIILGVPFLRNVYTVMAYEAASSGGIIGNGNGTKLSTRDADADANRFSRRRAVKRADIKPQLGLLNITDPTTAMAEFNQVRVLRQPLDSSGGQSNSNGGGGVSAGGKKITVGLEVLFGLLGFVVLCAVLFVVRWFAVKRRLRREGSVKGGLPGVVGGAFRRRGRAGADGKEEKKDVYPLTAYHGLDLDLAQSRSRSMVPSEDTQQTLNNLDDFAVVKLADGTYDSAKTKVHDGEWAHAPEDAELGFRRGSKKLGTGMGMKDPHHAHRASTSTTSSSDPLQVFPPDDDDDGETWASNRDSQAWIDAYAADQPALHGEWRPPSELSTHSHTHSHSYSNSYTRASRGSAYADAFPRPRPAPHERTLSGMSAHSAHSAAHGPASPLLESSLDVIGLDFGDAAAMVGGGMGMGGPYDSARARRRGSAAGGSVSGGIPLADDREIEEEMRRRQQRRASSGGSVGSGSAPPPLPVPGIPTTTTTMTTMTSATTARPRPGRLASGTRTSTTMSQVISADDIR